MHLTFGSIEKNRVFSSHLQMKLQRVNDAMLPGAYIAVTTISVVVWLMGHDDSDTMTDMSQSVATLYVKPIRIKYRITIPPFWLKRKREGSRPDSKGSRGTSSRARGSCQVQAPAARDLRECASCRRSDVTCRTRRYGDVKQQSGF